MRTNRDDRFSASEQGLGYLYQPRFALLQMLELPEETSVFIEKDDDLDFVDNAGRKSLGSLKHKAEGEKLTNLSTDFWKSVRIWLTRYEESGRIESTHRFYLFTTNEVSSGSFLTKFLSSETAPPDVDELAGEIGTALEKTTSELIQPIGKQLHALTGSEQLDFWKRITIVDRVPRIEDIPGLIKDLHMRSIRRDFRDAIFEAP